jgi:hydroxymethylpyrimidine pyrophosphatase-like HAD family hydrolase
VLFGIERDTFAHEHGFSAWDWTPPPDTRVGDALELLDEPPRKLVVLHAEQALDAVAAAVREVVGERAAVYISGEWVVEISAAGVNKATALAELCEERGIPAQDVIAFGDHQNDVPMLAWAGHGVAVENAHPDAVAVADELTSSCDDDGVARVLERLA